MHRYAGFRESAVTIFESLCLHPRIQLPDRLVAGLGSVDAVAI